MIGDCLVKPGHGFASSRSFSGNGFSDDTITMVSPELYQSYIQPSLVRSGVPFGGVAVHSCGNWARFIDTVVNIPNMLTADAAFSGETDPDPNPYEPFASAFVDSGIVLNARMVGNVETVTEGIAGGWLSSYLLKAGRSIDFSRKTAILVFAFMALPILIASHVRNIWIVTAIISLACVAHQGWATNIFTIVSDIFPRSTVGTVVGMSGFAGAVWGALAVSFVGLVLEFTGSYFLIFAMAGSMYLLAWLILKIMIPKIATKEID